MGSERWIDNYQCRGVLFNTPIKLTPVLTILAPISHTSNGSLSPLHPSASGWTNVGSSQVRYKVDNRKRTKQVNDRSGTLDMERSYRETSVVEEDITFLKL